MDLRFFQLNPFRVFIAVALAVLRLAAASLAAAVPATEASRQIAELRREIARHDEAYHRHAAPEISDSDYDQLKRRLGALEREFPDAAKGVAPLAEIGDDRSGLFQTVRHRERMLSLEKAYTETDLRAFHARMVKQLGPAAGAFVVEPKFDGIAVSVTYEQGKLVRAVTRGNGIEGDDVTTHVRLIADVPRVLSGRGWPAAIEVRGELYVPFADFERVNAEREAAGEALFAHPRNLAAGSLRQLDPREMVRRGVRAVFYGIGACEPLAALPATQRDLPARFREWGLPAIAATQVWTAHSVDDVVRAVEACRQARKDFPFPTDGAVVKLDSLAGQREAGIGEHAPRWALAFKFAPERVETRLLAITVQVGRSGALTPVAELAPVQLGGSTIARATLHNRDEIARKDLRIGDTVYVEKAGEIIPAIVGVNLAQRPAGAPPFVFPDHCPECGAVIPARQGEVIVRCTNQSCSAQLRRRLEHFVSQEGVEIAGFGPALVDALVRGGRVKDLPDIYRLTAQDLLAVGKSSGRATDNLLAAIEASKRAELWRFIHGLGIPQVGAAGARELALRCGSLSTLATEFEGGDADADGDAVARAARIFFAAAKNRAMVADLIALGVQPAPPAAMAPSSESAALAGKTFVLTGTLPMLTRAQAAEKIRAAGGTIATSLSRHTHFVVAGADPGTKLEQAKKLGVPILDEAGLLQMLAER